MRPGRALPALALGVFALVVASRIPFATTHLFGWDSVLYARALERFAVDIDPLVARPHPPGALFYVLAARAAAALLGDANAGLVAVSAVGAGLACVVALVGGRTLVGLRPAVLASAALATSPLLWQYGAVAYPYSVLAAAMGALGPLLWWARGRGWRERAAASLALGLLAGFRTDLLVLLGPLWLVATWRSPRDVATAVTSLGVGVLAWLLPAALLSGGIARYVGMVVRQAAAAPSDLTRDAAVTVGALFGLLFVVAPFVLLGAWRTARSLPRLRVLVALWIAPALAFYALVHIGIWGQLLSLAVPLTLLAAVGAEGLATALGRWRALALGAFALACLGNVAWFLSADVFSAQELRRRDASLAARIAYVRELPPGDAVILAFTDRLHALYYLPGVPAVLVPREGVTALPAPTSARVAVVFGDELVVSPAVPMRAIQLREDGALRLLSLEAGAELEARDGVIVRRR